VLTLVALTFPGAASAAVFQVTNTNDPGTGTCSPGNCSLRDAIGAASVGSGSDTVLVPPGIYTLKAGVLGIVNGMHIEGTSGAAVTVIDANNASGVMKVNGAAGAVSITGLTLTRGLAAGEGSAINFVGGQLTLSGDSFSLNSSGTAGASGFGAVFVQGAGTKTLTVTNSTFTHNAAGGEGTKNTSSGQGLGGAIAFSANGTLTVTGSTFSENTAGGNGGEGISSAQGIGGAIWARGNDAVAISNSTFTANRAGGNGGVGTSSGQGSGGAIEFIGEAEGATLTVAGSTFTANQAGGSAGTGASSGEGAGGAITANGKGSATLTNDTVEGNSVGGPIGAATGAGAAGGGLNAGLATSLLNDTLDGNAVIGASGAGGNINALSGTASLKNTIVAGGSAANGPNCAGKVGSAGHNLESTTPSQCGLNPAQGDLLGANPLLGPLQFNGGPTQTQALGSNVHLLPGVTVSSPAIDNGDNNGCPATDQRGVPRPYGPACDIGAYEVTPPSAITGSPTSIGAHSATLTGTVTANDADASVWFQITTPVTLVQQSPVLHVGGLMPAPVSASFSGLSPNTTYHYRLIASSMDGTTLGGDLTFTTSASGAGPSPGALVASLTALGETYSVFAVAGSSTPLIGQAAAKRHHKGTVFSFRLDQPATVKITIQTTARGRRAGRSCKPESHKLRRKPRCARTITVATLTRAAHAGLNKVPFSGRIGAHALKFGRYTAVFIAIDAAGASRQQSLSFTIVRR
jgi:hypothetical protein